MNVFEKGKKWTKENLFNGEYFIQKIDLNDKSLVERFDASEYWDEESGEIKWHKLLAAEFPLAAGIKHEMYIELEKKAVKVVIGDKTMTLRIENLPEEVYIGITGCEDINRFYNVKIDNE